MPASVPILSAPLVTTNAGFDKLQTEWDALARLCPTATPFQLWGWNRAWWRHFGVGKHLRIVTLRDAAGMLVAVLPLYQAFWYGLAVRVLRFLGTGQSDYVDALCLPGREAEAAQCLWQALDALDGWAACDFQPLRSDGFVRMYMNLAPAPFRMWEQIGEACPYLNLPPSWDALRANLGKKTRANVGYYDRALQKSGRLDVSFVETAAALDHHMTRLFYLHGLRWRGQGLPGVFASARVRRFHRDAAQALLVAGSLRLWSLSLNGGAAGAMLQCFVWGERVCYYQGGWEPSWSRLSPGTVLTAYALRHAIGEGRAVFDFLRGDEPYKAKWTEASNTVSRRIVARTDAPLFTLSRAADWEQRAERRIKEWARRRTERLTEARKESDNARVLRSGG